MILIQNQYVVLIAFGHLDNSRHFTGTPIPFDATTRSSKRRCISAAQGRDGIYVDNTAECIGGNIYHESCLATTLIDIGSGYIDQIETGQIERVENGIGHRIIFNATTRISKGPLNIIDRIRELKGHSFIFTIDRIINGHQHRSC